jgi:hypothetical protein
MGVVLLGIALSMTTEIDDKLRHRYEEISRLVL